MTLPGVPAVYFGLIDLEFEMISCVSGYVGCYALGVLRVNRYILDLLRHCLFNELYHVFESRTVLILT